MQYARYMHREDDDTALLDDIVYAIEEDITQNTLWVGTRSGLSILHDPDHRPSFQNFKPGEDVGDLPYNEVNSIMRARTTSCGSGCWAAVFARYRPQA